MGRVPEIDVHGLSGIRIVSVVVQPRLLHGTSFTDGPKPTHPPPTHHPPTHVRDCLAIEPANYEPDLLASDRLEVINSLRSAAFKRHEAGKSPENLEFGERPCLRPSTVR